MPAPKKAAKKFAKKAAKHAAKHAGPAHKQKDVRRAFEHLGRIESLQGLLDVRSREQMGPLVFLSQQELAAGEGKNAADILRACEHLSFAALAAGDSEHSKVSAAVREGIEEEYGRLSEKAMEHWAESSDRHAIVATMYRSSLQGADKALARKNFRQALELIRAAEALAHVMKHGREKLRGAAEELRLGR